MSIIDYKGVEILRKELVVLKNVTFSVESGEFVYLIGKVGSGKSSLLKSLYAEVPVETGEAHIFDYDLTDIKKKQIPYLRRKIGIVFQDFRLLPNKTAQENVAFAMEVIEAPRRLIRRRVRDVLDLVGLVGKADALPRNLSGGEQQRVAIARAIVNRPLLLIADEPTGNLDPETSQDIMEVFKKINHMGTTVLMVTHDKTLVDMMNKRVIEIDGGKVVRDEQKGGYDDET